MKLSAITTLVILCSAGVCIAQDKSLFDQGEPKQTSTDFQPAPAKMETLFGSLAFEGKAFPDAASAQRIYDEMDLQRATQAYMDFLPAVSLHSIVRGQARDFGFETSSDIGVEADFMKPSENFLTGNDVTVYAFASLDLKIDGPTVVTSFSTNRPSCSVQNCSDNSPPWESRRANLSRPMRG